MMKKCFVYYLLCLSCFFSGKKVNTIFANEAIYPELLNEKLVLFTDRNYYAVNEHIYFKAFNNSHPLIKERSWSKVLYVELLNVEGISVFKGKYNLLTSGANGYVEIPGNLPTGNYYLTAYTKWMRNFSPVHFSFVKLIIINPYKFNNTVITNINPDTLIKNQQNNIRFNNKVIECITNKPDYSTREEVVVTIKFPETWESIQNNCCISVVKKAAVDTSNYGIIETGITVNNNSNENNYIPEMYGISISGKIIDKNNKTPVSGEKVNLSVLSKNFNYFDTQTDMNGSFIFSLPAMCNKKEIYIGCENINQLQVEILIDNDFSTKYVSFNDSPFQLSGNEIKFAEEIMFNMQVNKAYNNSKVNYICNDTAEKPFYGPPSNTIYIKDYIELPTLGEFFFELVPDVLLLKKKGKPYLQVEGKIKNYPGFTIYKPLIFLDKIPVYNIEDILKLSPAKISHIEVINEIYVKGEYIYGGIISIFSLKGDLAGIKLPENSLIINFNGFIPQFNYNWPEEYNRKENIPDYRNCLYWNPDFIGQSGSVEKIKFFTSDVKGEYEILIRGVSDKGKIMKGTAFFIVN